MVFSKAIHYPLTYSSYVWINFLLPSLMIFVMVLGVLFLSLITSLGYTNFFLHMMFPYLKRKKSLKVELLTPSWTILVGHDAWRSIRPWFVLFILQSSLRPKPIIWQQSHTSGVLIFFNKYIGFPILIGKPNSFDFNFIMEKMQTRMACWKNKLLNKSGRLAFATPVLTRIPLYYMQTTWLP